MTREKIIGRSWNETEGSEKGLHQELAIIMDKYLDSNEGGNGIRCIRKFGEGD